jgi:hypothetical protein
VQSCRRDNLQARGLYSAAIHPGAQPAPVGSAACSPGPRGSIAAVLAPLPRRRSPPAPAPASVHSPVGGGGAETTKFTGSLKFDSRQPVGMCVLFVAWCWSQANTALCPHIFALPCRTTYFRTVGRAGVLHMQPFVAVGCSWHPVVLVCARAGGGGAVLIDSLGVVRST